MNHMLYMLNIYMPYKHTSFTVPFFWFRLNIYSQFRFSHELGSSASTSARRVSRTFTFDLLQHFMMKYAGTVLPSTLIAAIKVKRFLCKVGSHLCLVKFKM